MTHLFIINPAAGSSDRTAMYSAAIHDACHARNLDYRIEVSAGPGDVTRITREAAESGKEYRIYACGGDGTLNEVVAGAAGYDNVAVTVFSGGSGNDFVKIFNDPKAFFNLDRLLDAEEATFDLIKCNDDYALNICCVGLDARIGNDVSRYKRLPLLHGFRAYAASTVINIVRGISEHYVVDINGEHIDGKQTFVCVCNGRFYGGGFNPVPEADPSDGMLDVLIVRDISRLQIPAIIGKYKNGRYKELSSIARYFRTDHVTVTCDGETPINLDGEIRTAQVADFSVAKEKIRFFYPKGLWWKMKEISENE
ncbi:MAG: diacylglycerol kinase family lipid kinase [Oscillospiraceae bacterium]|nr:diacylglycerol kinase family lipid kinase [Oscillospiraceae bacterium]